MADKIRPLKIESSQQGTENDEFPTAADPNEDMVETHGIVLQSLTSSDEETVITRDADGDLVLEDEKVLPITLSRFVLGIFDPTVILLDNAGGFVYIGDGELVYKAEVTYFKS